VQKANTEWIFLLKKQLTACKSGKMGYIIQIENDFQEKDNKIVFK